MLGCQFGRIWFYCFTVTQRDVQKLLLVTGERNLQRCGSALGQFASWQLWLHFTAIPLCSITLGIGHLPSASVGCCFSMGKPVHGNASRSLRSPSHEQCPESRVRDQALGPKLRGSISPPVHPHTAPCLPRAHSLTHCTRVHHRHIRTPMDCFIHPKGTMLLMLYTK